MNELCPVTNLPIESRPEWTDLRVAEQYHVTFKRLGNDILLNIPYGNMTCYDSDRYFELRHKVILEAFPDGGSYVDLKSYEHLTGTPPFKERQKLMKKLLADSGQCIGYIIYGQSMLVSLIFKTAVAMIGRLPYPAKALNDYESSVLFAVNLTQSSDSSIGELRSNGFFSKKEWQYCNPNSDFKVDFMVSNDNILFTRFFGRGTINDLIHVEKILEMIIKEEFLTDGYAKITEFTNFSVGSFFVRKGYADILNNVHKRYKCSSSKSYICNTNPLLKLFLLLGAPLVNMELSFVKNPLIAIDAIRASGTRKKKAEKKYTITESEIHSLISMVSLIAWDADAEKPLFKPDNPLRQIETALDLIKKDRHVIFSEIESKNNDLKTAIEELKKARDDAEAAMTAKGQFLANMSHELRTPLNGVIGCTELLKETSLSEEQQSFLSIIHKSSVHLLAVINDILDYSKIESGQINLEKIPFDYASIIDDVVSIVYAQAIDKRIPVIVTVDKSLNKFLQGDPFRLKQILLNLLQNAIKFTNFGQIRIDIKVTSENAHSQHVTIDVIDTGIGIEDQKISHLFTQFVQADSSTTRKFGGTGLGLVIVKQLVELMNGTVSVRSSPGSGSTFSFVIPFIKTENSEAHFSNKTDSKFNIIILSQNDFEREWYEKNAIAYGGQILYCGGCFENGVETYSRRMVQQRDAICIVDPGFENADPAPLLKACLQAHEKVVYIKTTQGVQQAEQFKIDKVLTYNKPLKILDFQSILNSCIECDHFATTRNRVDSLLTDTRAKSGNTILLVEDSPTNQIVAKKLLEKIGYSNITICNNGREALQVLENNLFDLIFMDCQMPEIDGFEATEIIRSKKSNVRDHDIFIIAFTAHAMQEEIQKCFSAGMNDYILKPVTIDALKTVLKRWSDARHLHHNIKPDLV